MEDLLRPKGVNFKQKENNGVIDQGIHLDQFIQYLQSLKPYSSNGWVNLTIVPNGDPSKNKGFSHYCKLKKESAS